MQDYIDELNRRKREELARVMTHRDRPPLPQGTKTFLDYVSSPKKMGGLLADFTPVVGGIKGTMEEAEAGNTGWAAFNAATVPADLLSFGLLGTLMKGASKGRKTLGLLDTASDLPMNKAARNARAVDMGGDISGDWYHGTAGDITDLQPMGHVTNSPAAKEATFYVDDPEAASEFAMMAAKKTGEAPNVMPITALPNSSAAASKDWSEIGGDIPMRSNNGQRLLAAFLQQARDEGLDMVRITNADDAVSKGKKHTILAVLNQSKRRSKFAAFDPAKAESAALSAGLAGGALGLGLLGSYGTEE